MRSTGLMHFHERCVEVLKGMTNDTQAPMLPNSLTRRSLAEKSSPEVPRIVNNPEVSLETAHSTVQLGAEEDSPSR